MDMPQHRSDVLVLGGELAGVVAAALLARRGIRVLLLGNGEMEAQLGVGDLLAPRTPFLVADFEATSALRAVVEELGLRQDVRRLLPFCAPPLQFIDPEHRLDLHEDAARRVLELEREFGAEGETLAAALGLAAERLNRTSGWLENVPSLADTGFFSRRKLTRYLTSLAQDDPGTIWGGLAPSHPVPGWLQALVPFCTHADPGRMPPALSERAALRLVLGARHAPGGERALLGGFAAEFCGAHGAEILPCDMVQSVDLSRRGEIVVEIDGHHSTRVAKHVIDASRGEWLEERIVPLRAQRAYGEDRGQMSVGSVVEARYFACRAEAIPVGLASVAMVRCAGGEYVLIVVDRQPRPAGGDLTWTEERVLVTAATVVAAAGEPTTQELLRSAVSELMPFAHPLLLDERDGAVHARPLYRATTMLPQPLGPLRRVATSHGRMWRVGREVLPAWGLEGEFRAALTVVDRICADLGRGRGPRAGTTA